MGHLLIEVFIYAQQVSKNKPFAAMHPIFKALHDRLHIGTMLACSLKNDFLNDFRR